MKASKLLWDLYEYFREDTDRINGDFSGYSDSSDKKRMVVDFIAGMTDRFATMTFNRIFVPQPWNVY